MTRKRKNVDATTDHSYEIQTGHFPRKANHREEQTYSNHGDNAQDFFNRPQDNPEEGGYPGELIKYLQNFVDILKADELLDDAFDKIVEECKGSEAMLLKYYDSCKIIETIFGGSTYGATLFLQSVCCLKHKTLLDMFFNSTSVKTIEKLLYKFLPVSDSVQLQILSTFTDLICDNWNDAFNNSTSSFLIRCLAKISCGITKEVSNNGSDVQSISKRSYHIELDRIFSKIANMAIDFSNQESLKIMHCALVLHDILECDILVGNGKCTQFVNKQLSYEEGDVISGLCDKSCSRVWDKAVVGCSEDARKKLWEIVKVNIYLLAMDHMGNHPLQNLIKTTKCELLRRQICESIKPITAKLLQSRHIGVITAVVKCSETCLDLQEILIKELRIYFRANKALQKENFFFNILTNNKYDGRNFDPNQADIQGCLLLQTLFKLQKVKTLSSGVLSLDKDIVMQMALNKISAHVLQSVLKSDTVENEVKLHLLQSFENNWEKLIEHPIGSRTFDVIWSLPLTDINRKQNMMKKLVVVRNTSKNWKFAMLRCDLHLFRKDRKAWIAKMRNC